MMKDSNLFHAFLVKYAEIGIKGKNRYLFENALCEQIKRALRPLDGTYSVEREQGRIFVRAEGEFDYQETVETLQTVFGIAGICPVMVLGDNDWDMLTAKVIEYVDSVYEDKNFTFKVMAKRADKHYPMTSPEICIEMGAELLERFPEMRVDVHQPEVMLHVELRSNSYVYSKIIPGPGGMPVGTAGRGMLLLSGGIDSPVAGYMISKRGVSLDAVYFHAPPYTSDRAKEKVVDLARLISKYTGPIRLHVVNFTDIQLAIYEKCPHDQLTIIMRRYMMRIAEELAGQGGSLGLVTGESIGQVASQTMQSMLATNAVCHMPVYRPLVGFDKQEIVEIAQKIGTYETSILPFEDCCTIFVAKHPVTKPSLEMIEKSEENLVEVIEGLYREALEDIEVVEING